MSIIRQLIEEKKKKEKRIIIELGPGKLKQNSDAIGIDICKKESVDYVTDLNKGLIFLENDSVDEIQAFYFLEHVSDLELFMLEIYRVLKKDGKLIAKVPHFSNPYFYSDYTHQKFWGLYTIEYFTKNSLFKREVPKYYNTIEFELIDIKIIFASSFRIRNKIKKLFQYIFNLNRYIQELYEENFVYLFPSYELYFEIKK